MRLLYYIPYILLSIVYNVDCWKPQPRITRYLKPWLMPVLMLGYLLCGQRISWLIAGGIAFGFVGDVSLLAPKSHPYFFLLGLGAFLVGHLCYSGYAIISIDWQNVNYGWSVLYAAAMIGAGVFLYKLLAPRLGNMKMPVIAYEIVIMSMSQLMFMLLLSAPGLGHAVMLAGSLLFIVSDSILAYGMFVKQLPHHDSIVMITYTLAQLFIAGGSCL